MGCFGAFGFTKARDFFEAVSKASADVDAVRRVLAGYEAAAYSVGGGDIAQDRVSGGSSGRMERGVIAMIDAEQRLKDRLESDYLMLDAAHTILYGANGLASLCPSWWADVLDLRYCGCHTWSSVAHAVDRSAARCLQVQRSAFEAIDRHDLLRVARA